MEKTVRLLESNLHIGKDDAKLILEHMLADPRLNIRNKKNYKVPPRIEAHFILNSLTEKYGFFFLPNGNDKLHLRRFGDGIPAEERIALFDAMTPYVKNGAYALFFNDTTKDIERWVRIDGKWIRELMELTPSVKTTLDLTYEEDATN